MDLNHIRLYGSDSLLERQRDLFRAHRALACLYGGLFAVGVYGLLRGFPLEEVYPSLLVLGGLALLEGTTAYACRERRRWARVVTLVLGVLMLPSFLLGTIAGVYLLLKAWKPWAKEPPAAQHLGSRLSRTHGHLLPRSDAVV